MKKDKKQILQRLANNLSNLDSGVSDVFKSLDTELADIATKLKKSVELKTVAEANDQFKKLQKAFNQIPSILEELKKQLEVRNKETLDVLKKRLNELSQNIAEIPDTQEIDGLQNQIKELQNRKIEFPDFTPQLKSLEKKFGGLLSNVEEKIPNTEPLSKRIDDVTKNVSSFRDEIFRVGSRGGGAKPLQINVSSSVVSTRYADINFVSNGAIKWTATDDNTNKRVNITASLIAGGSGGAGTPGGANQQVQFNDNNTFGGSSTFTWNKDTSVLGTNNLLVTGRVSNPTTAYAQIRTPDNNAASKLLSLYSNGADWNVWLGTESIPNIYIGGSSGTSQSFWRANWNDASVAGNTFKSAANDATQVPLEIVGQSSQSAHYLDVTKTTQGDIFTIDGNGKVGINTSSPNAPLDVEKAVNNIIANFGNGNFGNLSIDSQSTPNRYRIYTDNGSPNIELLTSGGSINLNPTGSGQVGINNGSPQARLDIGLTSSIAGTLRMQGSVAGYVQLQPASTAGNWTMTLPANAGANAQYLMTDGNGISQWASVTAVGGSGITRSTSIITANTAAGSTGSTDYVYIATNSLNFTLPDAATNSNLYTLKNATSSVVVTAVGGDTIDGSGSVVTKINNQTLAFISDGNAYRIV